jgi:hypothetical protein
MVALVVALLASQAAPEERVLAVIPEGVRLAHRPSFGADGRNVAWAGVVDGRMWLYVGDVRRDGPYDCV